MITNRIKRGANASLPNGAAGEPLFTTDTYDLYIGKGDGTNQRYQKYMADAINGTGVANQLAYFSGSNTIAGSTFLTLNLTADNGYLILTGGATYKNADIWLNRYSNAWENAIRFQTNGTTDWYVGSSASGSNSDFEIYNYGTSANGIKIAKATNNVTVGGTLTATVGALATAATNFVTSDSGTLKSRTASEVLSDIGAQATSEKGQNNGYASLDSGGKVPVAQLPNSIMEYKGNWNAATNTPTLADGTGNAGDVYLCNVAGTVDLGSGNITFAVGDWCVYNGSIWQKSINSNAVVSVNGQTGVVTITDISGNAGTATKLATARTLTIGATGRTFDGSTDRTWTLADIGALGSGFEDYGTLYARVGFTTYRDHNINAVTDAPIRSLTNTEDNWIYLDRANAQYGIYYRNIDSDLVVTGQPTLPPNTIAFIGNNDLQAYISLQTGRIFGKSFVKNGGLSTEFLKADGTVDPNTYLTGNQSITLSGDISGTGTTTISTTIGALKVTNAMLAGSIDYAKMDGTTVPTWNQNTTGNAETTTKLATARDFTINGTAKSFDGSANVSWTAADIGLTSYLPLAGGTMTGQIVLANVTDSTDYTKGLRFPNDPFGGSGDISGLRLYRNGASGEKMTLELYVGNDDDDTINFATGVGGSANNDGVTINGNKIWNAGNLTPQTQLNGTGFVKASGTTITYDNTSYLPLTGGTLTNTGGSGTPILRLVGSSTDSYQFLQTSYNAALEAGKQVISLWGKSSTTKNSGYIGFQWNSDNGNDNFLTLGVYDANHILKLFGDNSAVFAGSIKASISALGSAATSFVVSDSGTLKSRTAAEVRSDISALTTNFDTTGTLRARTAKTTYRDNSTNPATDAPIRSLTNDEDNWIYLDTGSTEWGIYHRNIDSNLVVTGQPTLPANSIAFVGANNLQAYICLADGKIFGKSFVKNGGLSTEFLKADGTVDPNTYLTTSTAASTYLPLVGGTLTGALGGTTSNFTVDTNAFSKTIRARNINAGTGANSQFTLGNDVDDQGGGIALFSSLYTSAGQYRANGTYIYSNKSGGLTFHAEGANSMYLATNNTTAITINSSQGVTFSSTISATNFSGSSSGINTGDQTTITGNAGSATILETARNFTINGSSKSFNGSANVSWTASEIGLTSYLPLIGGTLTGALTITDSSDVNLRFNKTTAAWTGYSNSHGIQMIAANMNNTSYYAALEFGKALSAYNSAHIDYIHVGDDSTSNYMALGLFNADQILNITAQGRVGINTSTPSVALDVVGAGKFSGALSGTSATFSKSSSSGSGNDFPRLQVENTLATQGDGTTTFNFADVRIASGNSSVQMFLATTYAAGTWAPAGIINVSTNHDLQIKTNNTTKLIIANNGVSTFSSSASSYGQIRLIATSGAESSIGFRLSGDADTASWVLGKGAGTGDANLGFYYNGTRMVVTTSGNVGIYNTLYAINNVRPGDGGYGGIDFTNTGIGYVYSAKIYTFKKPDYTEYYGFTNDYGAGTGAQLSIISREATSSSGNIGFYTGSGTERMRIQANGDISFNGGSGSSGASTATPKNFRFNNDYSSGYTDASLKIYLFNSGSTIQGFTSGPAYDLQYHSSGSTNGMHTWYVGNTEVMKIATTTGDLTVKNKVTCAGGFFDTSDARIKTIIERNPNIDINVDLVKYTKNGDNIVRYGYIAQEVQKFNGDVVSGSDILTLNYQDIHSIKIAALEREIKELKSKLN